MQVVYIRNTPTKYHCCDCGKKLVSRAKSPQWRSIPANEKRCRSCSMKHRLKIKREKQQITNHQISK